MWLVDMHPHVNDVHQRVLTALPASLSPPLPVRGCLRRSIALPSGTERPKPKRVLSKPCPCTSRTSVDQLIGPEAMPTWTSCLYRLKNAKAFARHWGSDTEGTRLLVLLGMCHNLAPPNR